MSIGPVLRKNALVARFLATISGARPEGAAPFAPHIKAAQGCALSEVFSVKLIHYVTNQTVHCLCEKLVNATRPDIIYSFNEHKT